MIKIFNASHVRKIDRDTIEHDGITSLELMERAAGAIYSALLHMLTPKQKIYVFAGTGNNGGDALVISRMLQFKAFNITTYLVAPDQRLSVDCRVNKERLEAFSKIHVIQEIKDIPAIPHDCVIIDGLFGSGLNRPLEGLYKEVVHTINKAGVDIYSIDIPSGMYMEDNGNNDLDAIVKADYVFSLQFPKLALLLPENSIYCKQFFILDIGLSHRSIENESTDYFFIEKEDIASVLVPRDRFGHKGDYGRAYIVSGSLGKMGAAIMAARACLRAGVGLLTMHVPQCGVDVMQVAVPESMVDVDTTKDFSSNINFDLDKHTVGIGPGLGTSMVTKEMFKDMLMRYKKPMVIDADALNLIASEVSLKQMIPEMSILTPHPLEFDRLSGAVSPSGYQRLQSARSFAAKHKVYIVLKGAYTSIITPEGAAYFNSSGNPGMATGGSGDVLTGILTSLMAQGYSSLHTCLLGVYLHGFAGDLAAESKSQYSMLPSDIINCLGDAFIELQRG